MLLSCMLLSCMQVRDTTLAQLLQQSWPSGEAVLTAAEALAATAPHAELVILDVKPRGHRVRPAAHQPPTSTTTQCALQHPDTDTLATGG